MASRHNVVVFGDSWTDERLDDQSIVDGLRQLVGGSIKTYGVSAAGFGTDPDIPHLQDEIAVARDDSSVDRSTITDVVVICGTNNVVYGHPATDYEIQTYFRCIRQLYSDANMFYTPNFTNDGNEGRSYNFRRIVAAARMAGARVVPAPMVSMLTKDLSNWSNRQHLNIKGGHSFAATLLKAMESTSWKQEEYSDWSPDVYSGESVIPESGWALTRPDNPGVGLSLSGFTLSIDLHLGAKKGTNAAPFFGQFFVKVPWFGAPFENIIADCTVEDPQSHETWDAIVSIYYIYGEKKGNGFEIVVHIPEETEKSQKLVFTSKQPICIPII